MARPKSLKTATRSGTRLEELKALRILVSDSVQAAKEAKSWREISPLVGKLMELGREIDELEKQAREQEEASVPDEPLDPSTV